MKPLSLPMIILALLSCLASFSQSSLQLGASGVFSKTKGFGGEIVGNAQAAKNLSIGLGLKPFKFERHSKLYIPVFATLKYYYPLPKWSLFASFDPGYGIFPSEDVLPSDGVYSIRKSGTLYLSGGVGIMGRSTVAPYATIHFTKFGFTEHIAQSSQYRAISTFTFTAGIMLNKLTSKNVSARPKNVSDSSKKVSDSSKKVFFRREPFAPLLTKEYYEERSKNQEKAAWIMLGSGVALIGGGIFIASQQDDVIARVLPVVYMSGSGLITSLVSIPFFISASKNKEKAINFSSYLEMQNNPVKMQSGLLCNSYPALSVKLKF